MKVQLRTVIDEIFTGTQDERSAELSLNDEAIRFDGLYTISTVKLRGYANTWETMVFLEDIHNGGSMPEVIYSERAYSEHEARKMHERALHIWG